MQQTDETILINSNSEELSAEELIRLRNVEITPYKFGQKWNRKRSTSEENQELDKLYENLRNQLSLPRVERIAGRSLAEWDEHVQAACVLRKDGKFEQFGYSLNGKHYLEFYEALFLLELNRLQLNYHSIPMSIEQAYLLLLGETASVKFGEYLVYSTLSRAGYILVRHQNIDYGSSQFLPTAADCVWAELESALHGKQPPKCMQHSEKFAKIRQGMQNIKMDIKTQAVLVKTASTSSISNTINFSRALRPATAKRKLTILSTEQTLSSKRLQASTLSHQPRQSFVDVLKNDAEYSNFEQIFNKINIIQLQCPLEVENNNKDMPTLPISFDVYMHNTGFKKSSPMPPIFRLIVIHPGQRFPAHAEILQCHRLQLYKVPLLVAAVGESKHIQAYQYYFT